MANRSELKEEVNMSYKVTVEGLESFEIAKECVRSVEYTTDRKSVV